MSAASYYSDYHDHDFSNESMKEYVGDQYEYFHESFSGGVALLQCSRWSPRLICKLLMIITYSDNLYLIWRPLTNMGQKVGRPLLQ